MIAEQALVVGEQAALAHGRGRLQRRHLPRPLGDAEHVLAAGDGPAGDEHDAASCVHELGDVGGEPGEEAAAEPQVVVGHRGGPDLTTMVFTGAILPKRAARPRGRSRELELGLADDHRVAWHGAGASQGVAEAGAPDTRCGRRRRPVVEVGLREETLHLDAVHDGSRPRPT
jgi:hypothetical protein